MRETGLIGALLEQRYRVDAPLARGGMSAVYRGVDTRLDRPVAIKVMDPRFAADRSFVERFEREARSAARIHHPNVVAVHDQGLDGDHVYLVMELVDGGTLRDLLLERGALPPPLAVSILEPVLAALAAAHAADYVHRDVKPENVLIGSNGVVKVADFGLVRALSSPGTTKSSVILGTVSYLSPEQVTTGAATPRGDVYSAGILLYEMLTGAPPYVGDNPLSVAYRHANDDVPAPSALVQRLPQALDELVLRATRRDAQARPADGAAFLAELQRVRAVSALPRMRVPVPAPQPVTSAPPVAVPLVGASAALAAGALAPESVSETYPAPAQPAPAAAAPVPAAPAPAAPVPSWPPPAGSAPSAPTPSAPTPSAPPPSAPTPSVPSPSAPPPSEPAASAPTPPAPVPAERNPSAPPPDAAGSPDPAASPASAAAVAGEEAEDAEDTEDAETVRVDQPTARTVPPVDDPEATVRVSPVALASAGVAAHGPATVMRPAPGFSAAGPQGTRAMLRSDLEKVIEAAQPPPPTGPQPIPPQASGPQPRSNTRRFVLIGIIGVLVLGLLGAGTWWFASGRYTAVPPLSGQDVAAAETAARNAGLTPTVTRQRHNEIPQGVVIGTEPGAGAEVLRGDPVKLVVSSGRPVVPDVPPGTDPAQAEAAIKENGLQPQRDDAVNVHDEQVPAGMVVRLEPPAGTALDIGQRVVMVLSKGPAPKPVPEVRGQTRDEAFANLTNQGFQPADGTPEFSADIDGGRVIRTDPPAGTTIPADGNKQVTVVVSNAVSVPDLGGLTVPEAQAKLAEVGLALELQPFSNGGGRVITQGPSAGSRVQPGSKVQIFAF